MIVLRGKPALSDFRMAALRDSVRKAAPGLNATALRALYVYFLQTDEALPPSVLARVRSLLGADVPFAPAGGFYVTPRKGTISPWSSKATDIFRNCALTGIRRVERGVYFEVVSGNRLLGLAEVQPALNVLHDRMTEGIYADVSDLFRAVQPPPCQTIDVLAGGPQALRDANSRMGLALSEEEIQYLCRAYCAIPRNPTDVELVMFGQVNSEHCRHKIFNAQWIIDGVRDDRSLFGMIRTTHEKHPGGTLVAYRDNAAIIEGFREAWFLVRRDGTHRYVYVPDRVDLVMKVETHNHPTAISPYPGAATGVGGEIRDESATGIGGKSKAGLSAFMVSNLRIPGMVMPWEQDFAEFPTRIATPLQIMIEGPIGGARFGNEFGRPQLCGLFRTFEQRYNGRYRGYHKPIMVAGGMGNIRRRHAEKKELPAAALVIQIGGPAMRIGLGGGAASSMATGSNVAELDFDSVQRDNAEMERRCQEVIDACIALGEQNPILSIHDLGAGGLSNGCPELVSETGATFQLRKVPNEDLSMSPMEIWCCEAQERYVLAIAPEALDAFLQICRRERCPAAAIGQVTGDRHLRLEDAQFANRPIDIDIGVILGKTPRMLRDVRRLPEAHPPLDLAGVDLAEAVRRVLSFPAVANKTFLITIADRSVTGMVARDQMVGPYQVPISDVAVTAASYRSVHGEAMAMGERACLAVVSPPASGRMAVGEALTNIAAARVGGIGKVKLSANWMCACNEPGEDAGLFDTVKAVALDFCPALGVSIPVGKDSLSMRTVWETSAGVKEKVTAPLSLVVSAFAPVQDVRRTVTPDLKPGPSRLLLLDLGGGRNRLGGSALAQVYGQMGSPCPDADDPKRLSAFFRAIQAMLKRGLLMAYHDRSDGGLIVTLAEMAFGGRRGMSVHLGEIGPDPLPILFSEELGAVIQVAEEKVPEALRLLKRHGMARFTRDIGCAAAHGRLDIAAGPSSAALVFSEKIAALNRLWSETTYRMQEMRDNPECAQQEYDNLLDETDPGLSFRATFDPSQSPFTASRSLTRPRMAILREQGINGHVEMAAAFDRAGFDCVDIHMTDLLGGRVTLDSFRGLVACGGFSYGDVLGAGSGWAKSILFNEELKEMFRRFFHRGGTFGLGVCNGCQMMSQLKEIIPGARDWPAFTRNKSEQFEARYCTLEILPSPSVLLQGMVGSRLGIPVAHGEGFADFGVTGSLSAVRGRGLVAARYVDNRGNPTARYPFNPNGSADGITALTTTDGRVTIMMPHPERAFRSLQMSYRPAGLFEGEEGPWLRLFQNARKFVG